MQLGRLKFLNRFWTGKTFTGSTVTNRILGLDVITGNVSRDGDRVVIRYRFGLRDYLTHMPGEGDQWAGVMPIGVWQVQFILTKTVKERRMGQAFDRNGNVLGEAFGDTKREVFDELQRQFKDAHEIRIRSLADQLRDEGMTKSTAVRAEAGAQTEMPKYRSHKEVWALKIRAVTRNSVLAQLSGNESDGSAVITPEDEGYGDIRVDAAYLRKHDPKAGGYYVVYSDGYKSYSPAEAFESGYTRI